MTSDQFTYWLQGFAELNSEPPSAEQWQSIREHLATVFTKVTPPLAGDSLKQWMEDHGAETVTLDPFHSITEPKKQRRPLVSRCSAEPVRFC